MQIVRKVLRNAAAAALSVYALTLAPAAVAGEWIADAKTNCQVWDPNPQLDESVDWSGACLNGHADGAGTVRWLKGGAAIETDQGKWRGGKQTGTGVQDWTIGRYQGELADGLPNGQGVLTLPKFRYEGQFRDGKPNGTGTLTSGHQTVQGTWKDGCLQDSQRKASIGVPLSACR